VLHVHFFHAWADAVRAKNGAPPPSRTTINLPVTPPYGPGAVVPRSPPRREFEVFRDIAHTMD
jgi:hypothetical protein